MSPRSGRRQPVAQFSGSVGVDSVNVRGGRGGGLGGGGGEG